MSSIHIGLILCVVERGNEAIVPSLIFIVAVIPVKYINAEPEFMGCDDSLCKASENLENFCEGECIFQDDILVDRIVGRQIYYFCKEGRKWILIEC